MQAHVENYFRCFFKILFFLRVALKRSYSNLTYNRVRSVITGKSQAPALMYCHRAIARPRSKIFPVMTSLSVNKWYIFTGRKKLFMAVSYQICANWSANMVNAPFAYQFTRGFKLGGKLWQLPSFRPWYHIHLPWANLVQILFSSSDCSFLAGW